jgi:DNA ligase-1
MQKSYQLIQQLQAVSSRTEKEQIINTAAATNNTEFFQGARWALDSFITFGIKQVPTHSGPDGQGLPWTVFEQLLTSLSKRELTGNQARQAIELTMGAATQAEWNDWYRLILIKDLRCGVTEKTINKVLKAHPHIATVPVFECQLAHDGANHPNKIAGPKLLEHKIDGVRVLTIIDRSNNTVTQLSRNGKPLDNFGHVTAQLQSVIDQFAQSVVLDGEIMSSSFQALMKQVQRKSDVNAQDAVLMLFDMIPLADFRRGRSPQTQKQRSAQLTKLKPVFDQLASVQVIEQTLVNFDEYVGQLQFEEYNRQAIEQGLEGIMIKDPQAPYECKRTHHWLKIKPFVEVSLEVVETEQGTGRNENRLGALICQGTDGGHQIRVNVGSGFTDQQRDEIWQSRDTLIGQIVEVRADAITQNQDAIDTWSLRFPRFVKFRGFTAGQKI